MIVQVLCVCVCVDADKWRLNEQSKHKMTKWKTRRARERKRKRVRENNTFLIYDCSRIIFLPLQSINHFINLSLLIRRIRHFSLCSLWKLQQWLMTKSFVTTTRVTTKKRRWAQRLFLLSFSSSSLRLPTLADAASHLLILSSIWPLAIINTISESCFVERPEKTFSHLIRIQSME